MKNRVLLYLLFFMAFSFAVNAQNLVPNYSFENRINCINQDDEFVGFVTNWTGQAASGGLSLFTSACSDTSVKYSSAGVPLNIDGFQYAHTGNSYIGIQTYVLAGKAYYNYRNYAEAQLIDTLKMGQRYYTTFFVSLGDSVDYACSDIGAYFSDSALSFNGSTVKSYLIPQVANDPIKNPLTDTLNWMKVSGSFVAQGGEKYIVIGNFKTDSASVTQYMGNRSPDESTDYYYIDDVIVSPDSSYADSLFASVNNLTNAQLNVNLYPNPNNGSFIVSLNGHFTSPQIEVFNVLGEMICKKGLANNSTDITLIETSGIYIYRVLDDDMPVYSGKIILQ